MEFFYDYCAVLFLSIHLNFVFSGCVGRKFWQLDVMLSITKLFLHPWKYCLTCLEITIHRSCFLDYGLPKLLRLQIWELVQTSYEASFSCPCKLSFKSLILMSQVWTDRQCWRFIATIDLYVAESSLSLLMTTLEAMSSILYHQTNQVFTSSFDQTFSLRKQEGMRSYLPLFASLWLALKVGCLVEIMFMLLLLLVLVSVLVV